MRRREPWVPESDPEDPRIAPLAKLLTNPLTEFAPYAMDF
jgi:hypothetical protein